MYIARYKYSIKIKKNEHILVVTYLTWILRAVTGMWRTSGHCKNDLLLTQFLFKCYEIEEEALTYI